MIAELVAPLSLLVVGDSIVSGNPRLAPTLETCSDLRVDTWTAAGVTGAWVAEQEWDWNHDVVVVNLGTNDLPEIDDQMDAHRVIWDVLALFESNQIYWVTVHHGGLPGRVAIFNEALHLWEMLGLLTVISWDPLAPALTPDGVHPDEYGKGAFAGLVCQAVGE